MIPVSKAMVISEAFSLFKGKDPTYPVKVLTKTRRYDIEMENYWQTFLMQIL